MERRLIIRFRPEDLFAGCQPRPVEYGTVDGADSCIVNASPGFICITCGALARCKNNFVVLDTKLPSEVSKFSDS